MKRIIPLILLSCLIIVIISFYGTIEVSLGHLWYGYIDKKTVAIKQVQYGTVEEPSFHSNLFNLDRKYIIYLPPGYQDGYRRYPVLYLLHGFAGSYNDWIVNASLASTFDDFISRGELPPLIVVFPDGSGPVHTDSQYLDATLIKQPMESHLTSELIPLIDTEYRTIATDSARAIGGLSAGGYGAANIALHHPDLFKFILSFSGYFMANDPANRKLIGKNNSTLSYNSPLTYLGSENAPTNLHFFLSAGDEDGKYLQSTEEFALALANKQQDYVFEKGKGWHTWGNWREMIEKGLIWLGREWQVYK